MGRENEQDHEDLNYRLTLAIWTGNVETANHLASFAILRSDWKFPLRRDRFRHSPDSRLTSPDEVEALLDTAATLLGGDGKTINVGPFEASILAGRERAAMTMFTNSHPLDRSGVRRADDLSCLVTLSCLGSPALIWRLTDDTEQREWEHPGGRDDRSALDHLVERGGKAIIGFLRSVAHGGDPEWVSALTYLVPQSAWEERWGEWGSGVDALYQRGGEALSAYQDARLDLANRPSPKPARGFRL